MTDPAEPRQRRGLAFGRPESVGRERGAGDGGGVMTECCGQKRAGRFCSECGRALSSSPLLELLAHCRKSAMRLAKAAETRRKSADYAREKGRSDSDYNHDAELDQANSEKWQRWGDALAEVLAERAEAQP